MRLCIYFLFFTLLTHLYSKALELVMAIQLQLSENPGSREVCSYVCLFVPCLCSTWYLQSFPLFKWLHRPADMNENDWAHFDIGQVLAALRSFRLLFLPYFISLLFLYSPFSPLIKVSRASR